MRRQPAGARRPPLSETFALGALLAALGGFHIQLKLPLVGNAQDAACLGTLGHFRQLDGVKLLVAVCADGVFAV